MSLRELLKQRITKNIIQDAQSKMKKKYTVIVADDKTIKILHHCFRMHELNELNIGVVLNVRFNRERVKVSPIYFLSDNYKSAQHMCDDYKDPKQTRYAAPVHAYFCTKVASRVIELVKTSPIRKYMKSFCEINCDFLVLERRVFSFTGGKKSFESLYTSTDSRSDELALRAQQLVGLCLTIGEEPYIRYSTKSRNAKTLAELFAQNFKDTKSSLQGFTANSERATLLIIDRSDDPLTPLMHDLSFGAMVMDCLHSNIIENGTKMQFADGKSKEMPNERDSVWCNYRHMFIGDVVSLLPKEFDKWQNQNAVVQMKKSKKDNVSTKGLIRAARDMPQYQQLVKQYGRNIDMASLLISIFKEKGLKDVVSLEQDMATGIDENGKKVDRTRMQKEFCNGILMDSSKEMQLKLRIFMQYVISQGGMKPEQRRQLLEQAGFDGNTENTILNLGNLGVTLQSNRPGQSSGGNKNYWKFVQDIAKSKVETTEITRHTSYVEWALLQQKNANLKEDAFAWVVKPKANANKVVRSYRSHRKQKNNDSKNNNGNDANKNDDNSNKAMSGPRMIVFFLGGVCHSEIRSCYVFAKEHNIDVFVGSTLVYSPHEYVECFQSKKSDENDNKNDGNEGNEQKNDY